MINHIDLEANDAQTHADFTAFVADVEPRLRRALVGSCGVDRAADAVAEAFTWAWANWERVVEMNNPAGYLYRVARSSQRHRPIRRVRWLIPRTSELPDVEPGLVSAVEALPDRQRSAVWLVHACQWTHAEVADALDISTSAVSTHVARGMATLRTTLGAHRG